MTGPGGLLLALRPRPGRRLAGGVDRLLLGGFGKPRVPAPYAHFAQALAQLGLVDFGIGGALRLDLAAQSVGRGDLHLRMHLEFAPPEEEFVALGVMGLEPCFVLHALLVLHLGKAQLLLLQPLEFVDPLLHDGDAKRGRSSELSSERASMSGGPA